jgi:hypothetical protein
MVAAIVSISNTVVIYSGILTLENVGTVANYCGIFITLAPGPNVIKLFSPYFTNFCNKLERLLEQKGKADQGQTL